MCQPQQCKISVIDDYYHNKYLNDKTQNTLMRLDSTKIIFC